MPLTGRNPAYDLINGTNETRRISEIVGTASIAGETDRMMPGGVKSPAVRASSADRAVIPGGTGDDSLPGTPEADSIAGGDGHDTLDGAGGDDYLVGQRGDDSLLGGDGNDRLYGGRGADTLLGGADDDTLTGGAGNDSLEGGLGNDYLSGGDDDDELSGGDGFDSLYAGAGNDIVQGDAGDDTLHGGDGNDTMHGGGENDYLAGNSGDDSLTGGDGDDRIYGGRGADTIQGDAGNDTLAGGGGDDILEGGDGNDYLGGNGGADTLHAGAGDDLAYGGAGDDILHGDDGADLLSGEDGNDTLDGGTGDDTLLGGDGIDTADFSGATGNSFFDYAFETVTTGDGETALQVTYIGTTGVDTGTDLLFDMEFGTFAEGTFHIDGTNNAPVLGDDTIVVNEDNIFSFGDALTGNDFDPDNSLPRSGDITLPQTTVDTTGTIGLVTAPSILTQGSYDPNGQFDWLGEGETATDSFQYTVSDGNGGVTTATVTVTIEGQNDAEVAVGQTVTGVTPTLIANYDSDYDTMIYSLDYHVPLSVLLAENTGDSSDIAANFQIYTRNAFLVTQDGLDGTTTYGGAAVIDGDELVVTYDLADLAASGSGGAISDSILMGYHNVIVNGAVTQYFDSVDTYELWNASILTGRNYGDPLELATADYLDGGQGEWGGEGVNTDWGWGIIGHDGTDGAVGADGNDWGGALLGTDADEILVGLDAPDAGDGGTGGRSGDGADGYFLWTQTRAGPVPLPQTGFNGGDGGDGGAGGDSTYLLAAEGGDDTIVSGAPGAGGDVGSAGGYGTDGERREAPGILTDYFADGGSAGEQGSGGPGGFAEYLIYAGDGNDVVYAADLRDVAGLPGAYEIDGGAGNDHIYFFSRTLPESDHFDFAIRGGAGDDVIERSLGAILDDVTYAGYSRTYVDGAGAAGSTGTIDGGAGFDQFVWYGIGGLEFISLVMREISLDGLMNMERISLEFRGTINLQLTPQAVAAASGDNVLFIDDGDEGFADQITQQVTLGGSQLWLQTGSGFEGEDGTVYDIYTSVADSTFPVSTTVYIETTFEIA
ncbi:MULTISPECIES: Ig-like domain-containing protein [Salipiger]|nr:MULTISPECIES: Ig-like domain-containing protein [Salipiger]SFC25251.1 Hemolysin-type calcium-binding repeat-containing protein [Salipiger profundus]